MKFKIIHPESDSEFVVECESEDEVYEKYGDGLCNIINLEEEE